MSYARVIGLLLCMATSVFSVMPSDLVFTPHAEFPPRGQTELGYQLTYYTIESLAKEKGIYFNHSISEKFRLGTEFYETNGGQRIFYHFAYRLGELFSETNYRFVFAGTINYLSLQPVSLDSNRAYDGTITSTWGPKKQPFRAHLTLARRKIDQDFILLGALSYKKDWGHLSLEWDGHFINLSSQFSIYDTLSIRSGITKNFKNDSEILFKMAIGFTDVLPIFHAQPSDDAIGTPTKNLTVETSVGLNHLQDGLNAFYKGDYRHALKSYKLAVEFFPESAMVHERLGSIYYKLGEFDLAQVEWEKAMILAPNDRLKSYINMAKEKGDSLSPL